MFLNESSYFYDVILPECCYLERTEPLPHAAGNHRVIGGLENPWTVPVWQKVVEPKDARLPAGSCSQNWQVAPERTPNSSPRLTACSA